MMIAEGFAVLTVAAACVSDVSTSRIPNALTFAAAALAVVFHATAPGGLGVTHAVLGLSVGLAVFFPLFALGAMGAGDVKLMAAIGAWVGWNPVILVALYGSVAGGVLALVVAARRRYLKQAFSNIRMLGMFWLVNGLKPLPELTLESTHTLRLPYAVAIAAGLAVTLWRA
jgi:prepilin peptidase CpaA